MVNQKEILVLIPAHNESSHIGIVVSCAAKYLPVLVIDDGSQDDTAQIAEKAGARVIRQFPNQGKGAALINGLTTAYNEGYQGVITLDGDGQHDPSEISTFIKAYNPGVTALIIGRRDFSKMPLRRRIPNILGTLLFSSAVKQHIPDNQSGYRLIDRKLFGILVEDTEEKGFEFEVDMLVTCIQQKWSIEWVPIKTIYADETSHMRPMHHLMNFFRILNKARKRLKA